MIASYPCDQLWRGQSALFDPGGGGRPHAIKARQPRVLPRVNLHYYYVISDAVTQRDASAIEAVLRARFHLVKK